MLTKNRRKEQQKVFQFQHKIIWKTGTAKSEY